jgi:hypothetical protein
MLAGRIDEHKLWLCAATGNVDAIRNRVDLRMRMGDITALMIARANGQVEAANALMDIFPDMNDKKTAEESFWYPAVFNNTNVYLPVRLNIAPFTILTSLCSMYVPLLCRGFSKGTVQKVIIRALAHSNPTSARM